MAGKRRRSNSRADDGAAGEHEDEDAAAPVGPTASVSEVQQQDFQPNPSQHKERAIPQYGGPQANAAAASQINPGDAGSLGRAPLIRNDHLDPRGPAERQTSGDTGEGANHADHPFANGFTGATVTNSENPNIAEISIAAGAAGASSTVRSRCKFQAAMCCSCAELMLAHRIATPRWVARFVVFPPSHTFFDPSVFAGSLY